ncbi:MAG TPA: DinB family protein [Candidatus Acidoferrales bacterium]|nr:DinB family protein [Candidatus Acidoferrales bacterium]
MQETPQQYRQRILANLEGQEPVKVQAATAGRLARAMRGASRQRLARRPAPGKWSVNEILAHLAEAEIVIGYRIRSIAGAPGTPIQAYDQDAWAAAGNYAARDAKKSLALFRAVREANLEWLRRLRPEQWKHYGMHAERGEESIETIVSMMAGHDLNHLKQVEALLATKRPKR